LLDIYAATTPENIMLKLPTTGLVVSHLLFDLDGTLVDSSRLTCTIINAMLADRGIDFTADLATVRAMDAIGGEAMIAAVMGRHCRKPAAEIAEFRARHAAIDIPPDLAFPGAADGLAALNRAGLAMAICSNKPQQLCDTILGALHLADHFQSIIGARPDLPRKPAADPARLAMQAIGARPATTLYIGDSSVDIATARAVGLPAALVGWGYGVVEARKQAPEAPVFPDMSALLEYILPRSQQTAPVTAPTK
jgi:phosphoglycolate phosphatase